MEEYQYLLETLQKIRRSEERLEVLIENKEVLENKVREKKLSLEKESDDVDKLEGMSLVGFVHLLKGTLIDKLDKEEREAMIAKNQYEFACQELDVCLKEIINTQSRIKDKYEIEREYTDLLKSNEQKLMSENTEHADDIKRLMNELYYHSEIIREITEAEAAGLSLKSEFACILESFDNAEALAIVDVLEGGLLVSSCSHETVKTTNAKLVLIQQEIRKYHLEIQDVFNVCDIDLDGEELLAFSDTFLEGVMMRLDLDDKIAYAKKLLNNMVNIIMESLEVLKTKKIAVSKICDQFKEEKRKIIEAYMNALEN